MGLVESVHAWPETPEGEWALVVLNIFNGKIPKSLELIRVVKFVLLLYLHTSIGPSKSKFTHQR